ncbi:MAG: hypothetical protein AMJ63_13400 [Myxococcales bacterium SG8_38_1]|nr:MAG: hypothetical protein AMJ63_13400 [Myxococcales bacterium SG8_38_1]
MSIQFPKRFALWLQVVLIACLWAVSARADWINLSGAEVAPNIAEVTVHDDHVKVVLEAYVGDLETFIDLVPPEWLKQARSDLPPQDARMRRFAERGLRITTDSGERLQPELLLVEPRLRVDRRSPFAGMVLPFTRQRAPEPPADKRVLYAELKYPFRGEPKALLFTPPSGADGRPKVSIGFIVYHKTVPVIDFRYLSAPARLALDWNDPWYSKFDNPNLRRHHRDAMMSFLYVEPYEVRHEILTRVKDLEQWMDLGLRGKRYIEPDELEPLKQRIGEFLLARNPVRVDGRNLKPILDRTNYVQVGLFGIRLVERPQRLEITGAMVGVIITYLTDALPKEVTVDWDLFTPRIQRVPAFSIDPAGPLPTFVTPDDSRHRWQNFLKNYTPPTVVATAVEGSLPMFTLPLASLVCVLALIALTWATLRRARRARPVRVQAIACLVLVVAAVALYPVAQISIARPALTAPPLEDAQAQRVLASLLRNVYRAFDFRAESDVYDKLAISVSGDLLADIYLQNRRSFAIQRAGGAQAKIKSVEIQEAVAERLDDRPLAYSIKGDWAAQGTVGHWGHVHTRRNRYDAVVTVEAVDGVWKITDLEVLEEQRVDPTQGPGAGTAAAALTTKDSEDR